MQKWKGNTALDLRDDASLQQACAFCGNAMFSVVSRFADGVAVVRCIECRLVRTYPYPTFDYENNKGYAMGYNGREPLFRQFASEFMDFVALHAAGRSLLEVGSGMGFLLDNATRRGFEARGLEINRWEVRLTQERGLNVQFGTLEEANLPSASADVVCMNHVLEHVLDLRALLAEVHRILKPDGVVALAQPYYGALLPRVVGRRWYGWQTAQHVWHFDPPALSRVFTAYGFIQVALSRNSLYHPWMPQPPSHRLKVIVMQTAAATVARVDVLRGRGDQFYLAARRAP